MKLTGKNSENGFTLTEVLLATAILAFAVCAILAAYISCVALAATSKNTNIATDAALGLAEEIRSTTFAQIFNDYNLFNFTLNDIPESRGVVYVNDTNPELLEVTISICWKQGNRIIGADTNLNGILDAGEQDIDGDGLIHSPVQLVTRISNR